LTELNNGISCSCGYKFKVDEIDDLETCPKCHKMFCFKCGDSVTKTIISDDYFGMTIQCGACKELLA